MLGIWARRSLAYCLEVDFSCFSNSRTFITRDSNMVWATAWIGGSQGSWTGAPWTLSRQDVHHSGKPPAKPWARRMEPHTKVECWLGRPSSVLLRQKACSLLTCLTHWEYRAEEPWKCGWNSPLRPIFIGGNCPDLTVRVETVWARPRTCFPTEKGKCAIASFSIFAHSWEYLSSTSPSSLVQRSAGKSQLAGQSKGLGVGQTSRGTDWLNLWKWPWMTAWSGHKSSTTDTLISNSWSSGDT